MELFNNRSHLEFLGTGQDWTIEKNNFGTLLIELHHSVNE